MALRRIFLSSYEHFSKNTPKIDINVSKFRSIFDADHEKVMKWAPVRENAHLKRGLKHHFLKLKTIKKKSLIFHVMTY